MTGIEITLLVIGIVIVIGTFIFSSKLDATGEEAKAELTDKQKEDIRKQIIEVLDDELEQFSAQNEKQLDRMSTQKMNEMNEYADTILNEINRNHNEVMFLYDMLTEKNKELKNTVRDVNNTQKELKEAAQTIKSGKGKNTEPAVSDEIGDVGFMASEAALKEEKKPARTKKETIMDQLDAATIQVGDEVQADAQAEKPAPKKKSKSSAKNAAARTRTTVKKETVRESNKDITVFENGNNNEKILELSRSGKSNMEIAKELGIGVGEVKLVVDLYAGGR